MKFSETGLAGAWVIGLEPIEDERGSFARTFAAEEFAARNLESVFVQCNLSVNRRAGTLRGMHYQLEPFAEAKLVRCSRGSLFDVIVDLRPGSATALRWFGLTMRAREGVSLYVPRGFAHGFLTLEDDTEIFYQMSNVYSADHARGFRYDDPKIAIDWPGTVAAISGRDRSYAPLDVAGLSAGRRMSS